MLRLFSLSALLLALPLSASAISLPAQHKTRQQHLLSSLQTWLSPAASEEPFMTTSLHPTLTALSTMQARYFELWLGTWPSSIDWTAAVFSSFLSGTLSSLSALEEEDERAAPPLDRTENTINKYFTQLSTFHFGQDAFALRGQAYDDMLWVVLGWLDGVRFIAAHTAAYARLHPGERRKWHGEQFTAPFAHRARIFYELARKGWDTRLCGGGMVWSPWLRPYKNAVTNELWIAASVAMYLHFPGDNNTSPYMLEGAKRRDKRYLKAAVDGYDWLKASGMTNARGLYVDGFHISQRRGGNNTRCDERNEMVYTYNQGVLLSGLRGLWDATANASYLADGHDLIRSVIAATGFSLDSENASSTGKWAGLGRDGILEEVCDAGGYCSQNGQVFKGIFFHHLVEFCRGVSDGGEEGERHWERCASYGPWVVHNARAAWMTRDGEGRFGMWWGEHPEGDEVEELSGERSEGEDYQNPRRSGSTVESYDDNGGVKRDVNDRGRGRTVETQGGGVAVLRAAWEFVRLYRGDGGAR